MDEENNNDTNNVHENKRNNSDANKNKNEEHVDDSVEKVNTDEIKSLFSKLNKTSSNRSKRSRENDSRTQNKINNSLEEFEKKIKFYKEQEVKSKEQYRILKDQYQILFADFSNYRKRITEQISRTREDVVADLTKNFLPLLDNISRAEKNIENIDKKAIELLCKQSMSIFDTMEVKEIKVTCGDKYDFNYHEAVVHIEDDSYGENEIIEILEKGYIYKDKIIRYAKVKVAN